jgi:hypothetical protein
VRMVECMDLDQDRAQMAGFDISGVEPPLSATTVICSYGFLCL